MLIGFFIVLILLWIRTEYLFLLFYVFANALLVFLIFDVWVLTWADAFPYTVDMGISIAFSMAVGGVFVALFKWIKSRKTGADKNLDKDIERIRAEIAARDQSAT